MWILCKIKSLTLATLSPSPHPITPPPPPPHKNFLGEGWGARLAKVSEFFTKNPSLKYYFYFSFRFLVNISLTLATPPPHPLTHTKKIKIYFFQIWILFKKNHNPPPPPPQTSILRPKKNFFRFKFFMKKTWTADSCNEQVSLEHSGALRVTLEKLWWDVNRWRTQGVFQWRRRQTWVWGWISFAQGRSGCCLRMPASLQQTDINPPESSSFQYHHHTGLCTNSWSWWQWGRSLLPGTPGNHRPNTKEGHSGCTRGLEYISWEGCTGRLGRSLWTLLQCRDK